MRHIIILIASLVVAIAVVIALPRVLLSIESEASSTGRIDVTASRYLVGLIWILSIAILSAVVNGFLLWSRRDTHRLSKPAWVEWVKAFVVGGGAAGGSFAIVSALLRDLIDYAEWGRFATHQPLGVVLMGLFIAFLGLWALAYTVMDTVSKPLESDIGQPGKQGNDNG